MESLQSQFVKSRGAPILIGGEQVVQMDTIQLSHGFITISFISEPGEILRGIAVEAVKGKVMLSDGDHTKILYIWNERNLQSEVSHEVFSSTGQLRIWNIYQQAPKERENADAWTNNAGMVVEKISENERFYYCSDGLGPFDKTELSFRLKWEPSSNTDKITKSGT